MIKTHDVLHDITPPLENECSVSGVLYHALFPLSCGGSSGVAAHVPPDDASGSTPCFLHTLVPDALCSLFVAQCGCVPVSVDTTLADKPVASHGYSLPTPSLPIERARDSFYTAHTAAHCVGYGANCRGSRPV